jgi:hypothetical protein
LSPEELRALEGALKKVGKRADALMKHELTMGNPLKRPGL